MCKTVCEVFSRTVGYIRPIYLMNDSKQAEVHDRHKFDSIFSVKKQTTLRL
jgi:anaerobic ribonucleoside-triphosphate reductase